ncbi:lysophospholipid acyltransferase family protein [Shimazuella kribbensis]|uniref:lysophospholipid acyltransferase family protein n=1 Tax=Shimazuella kribbensis TaxID=139808 RepID=UPI0004147D23|nr:lysophospholipid acyltransferase family protein [Shimazuella kribbensis]
MRVIDPREVNSSFRTFEHLPRRFLHFLMGGNLRITVSDEAQKWLESGEAGILAPNHSAYPDPPTVEFAGVVLGLKTKFMAKSTLWWNPVLFWIFWFGNFIPVRRKNRKKAKNSLLPAKKHLLKDHSRKGGFLSIFRKDRRARKGGILGIYPEGLIPHWKESFDREPGKFRVGVILLQYATGVVIIPVFQFGARKVMSGGFFKKFFGVITAWYRKPLRHVHFGDPIKMSTGQMEPADGVYENVKQDAERFKEAYMAQWRELDPNSFEGVVIDEPPVL